MMFAFAAVALASLGMSGQPAFQGHSEPIAGKVKERMVGNSWHSGCPVGLGDLRLLELTYVDFHGHVKHGRLVVNGRYDDELLAVFKRLYNIGYPIRRMSLVDRYGSNDRRSTRADNTSAFNCRFVAGTSTWSMHAYGLAIDVNPVENPYVSGSHFTPSNGEPYLDRSRNAPGMIHDADQVEKAFARRAGWEWLGDGPQSIRDYQHFSENGT
jgi:poly-gamma-glutamate synthesis protein (capsule biosynthesis protein)